MHSPPPRLRSPSCPRATPGAPQPRAGLRSPACPRTAARRAPQPRGVAARAAHLARLACLLAATLGPATLTGCGADAGGDPTDLDDDADALDALAPDAADTLAPDAADALAPDAADTLAPDATDTLAPDATDTLAPDATDTLAPDAADATDVDVTDVTDATDADATDVEPPPAGPTRYPDDRLRSPLTPHVLARLAEVRAADPGRADDVFMKVGASGTVSDLFLKCLSDRASNDRLIDLAGRPHLQATLDHFNASDLAGASPFDRDTLAARVGRTAAWVQDGDPSPLAQEIAALNPRFALVNYGTNDMNLGITHRSALWPFVREMSALLDDLRAQGIIPIITGLNPRGDSAEAALWVPTYNAVTRALAEARQLPYIDLYQAVVGLVDMGLVGDGLHGNAYVVGGRSEPCVFTAAGLGFNYNTRNLLTLEALDDLRATLLDGAPAPDLDPGEGWSGEGRAEAPYVIDRLPFSHSARTDDGAAPDAIDAYPACDSGQDESGPERHYVLRLDAPTPLRVMVFDSAGADIDLHLLAGALPDPDACVARHDRVIERALPAGDHRLVLDTYVSGGAPLAGDYLLVVVACEPGDASCD